MNPILTQLPALDRALVSVGFPAMTDWWRETMAGFYATARRQLVLRCGRRAGKSSTLCRVAVAEALFGDHAIPPGDVGVVAFVSVRREEASERLRTIKAILDVLGVRYKPVESGLELLERPIVFRVFTASLAGVVGGTIICAVCDEVARWRDAETGSNPATEVLASLRPALAGQPNARIFLSSSPMGRTDAHATAFEQGDTDFQAVASAETWVARPELTEADCRALEPDEDTFRREYGIIPFDGSTSSLVTEAALLECTRRGPVTLSRDPRVTYFAAEDPANRGGNAWCVLVGYGRQVSDDMFAVIVADAREWRAPRGGSLDSDSVYRDMAGWLASFGVTEMWTDQWSFDARRAIASRHGLSLLQSAATQSSKVASAESFRRRVADRLIELPDLPAMRADCLGVRKWISKNGAFSIELERVGGRHCDWAPALFLLADKVFAEEGSPSWASPSFEWQAQGFFDGQFDPGTLGQREKKPPRHKSYTLPSGSREIVGNPPFWPSDWRASWKPFGPAFFTPASCSAEFRAYVADLRLRQPELQ
ncbi:MAG TPA: hypothetical protein VGG39_28570 [Polyangiaceae bacterium]|jgi:hypothetical protein